MLHKLFKALVWHIHLSPDLQKVYIFFKVGGNGFDGFKIVGNILAGGSVTSCGSSDEGAAGIFEGNRKTVYLRLNAVNGVLHCFFNSFVEILKFLKGKGILKAFHFYPVLNRRKKL